MENRKDGAAIESSTRDSLIEAAIGVIARDGLAGLSYRVVATEAKVSLALVNYYFPSKSLLIACVSDSLLGSYAASVERAIERMAQDPLSKDEFVFRLVRNAIGRDRARTLCWAEMSLDSARNADELTRSARWQSHLDTLWEGLAGALGQSASHSFARTNIDLVIGWLFISLVSAWSEDDVRRIIVDHCFSDPREIHVHRPPDTVTKGGAKGAATRGRLIQAAIDLLVDRGASAVTFRTVGERSGFSPASVTYHFATISDLLTQAQVELTDASKLRYRAGIGTVSREDLSLDALVDLTAAIFIREATEYAALNLAFFSNWIESTRRSELRPSIRGFVYDRSLAWQKVLITSAGKGELPGNAGVTVFALFIGKLIRILSQGSGLENIARVRQEFSHALADMIT